MNLAAHVGDKPGLVQENRRILIKGLGLPSQPAWLDQQHGCNVVCADDVSGDGLLPASADAAFSRQPGPVCAVMTADCLPVLICDADGTRVAAVHAGWRGLTAGVLKATVLNMGVAPEALMAWIGPAIGVARYEVGEDVRTAARQASADAERFLSAGRVPGKYLFDLAGLARHELVGLGLSAVTGGETCCASDRRFYSYRRDGVTGRMATLAWLAG